MKYMKESMSRKDQQIFNKLKTRGNLILQGVNTSENSKIQLYSIEESRGYQTDFNLKEFFYLIGYRGNDKTIIPVTSKNSLGGRTKQSMMDWWDQNYLVDIIDRDAVQRWLDRK